MSYTPNGYVSASSNSSLNALRSTGANYVALIVFWRLDTHTSNTVYPDPNATPTDAAVIAAINDIHARGMSVMLKLHLIHGDNNSLVEPTDPCRVVCELRDDVQPLCTDCTRPRR